MKYLLYILFISLLFLSCKKDLRYTSDGTEYQILKEGSGENVKEFDYIRYNFKIIDHNGKVIQDYIDEKYPKFIKFSDTSASSILPFSNLREILVSSKKDAKYLIKKSLETTSDTTSKNLKTADNNFVLYELEIRDILNYEEYLTYKNNLAQKEKEIFEKFETNVKNELNNFYSGDSGYKDFENGIKVKLIEAGEGSQLKLGDLFKVHYLGYLKDGKKIADSYKISSGMVYELGSGQIIKGWNRVFQNFNKGSKGYVFIPSDLAYGPQGNLPEVPGNSDLFFYIEILDVKIKNNAD